jgi:hypothetical protein
MEVRLLRYCTLEPGVWVVMNALTETLVVYIADYVRLQPFGRWVVLNLEGLLRFPWRSPG